ncbi:MAG: recombinase family protein [Bacillota bacterium]|nr:recombinase family protein [Bacillota bacterium]
MNVVGYIRVGIDKEEQETSISTQIDKFKDWAETNNHNIVNIGVHHTKDGKIVTSGLYIDEGFSAWKDKKRLAFKQMLEDARKGFFQILLSFRRLKCSYRWGDL